MTPLPENPNAVALVNPQGQVIATASNIAPDFKLTLVTDRAAFEAEACNKPFDTTRPQQPQQPLNSAFHHPKH
jgi:hypothetical protein